MNIRTLILLVVVGATLAGCAAPQGNSVAEKKSYVYDMRAGVLADAYEQRPITRQKVAQAAGYATFSNININLFLLSSGNGYGIVHNNATGQETFMKMRMMGIGLGAGAKDFRALMIFKNQEAMKTFIEEGWEAGAHADAAAKSGDSGVEAGVADEVTGNVEIY
ncbi:MAG: hypothetical protein GY809_15005, partial [Planctomycetes bacterium]|nr:hypothetical protein [Planctomycetota bacterium]